MKTAHKMLIAAIFIITTDAYCLPDPLAIERPVQTTGQYAFIYNVGIQSLKQGDAIRFDSHGQKTIGIKHNLGAAEIVFQHDGIYSINCDVTGNEVSTIGLFLNGTPIPGGVYGGGSFGQYRSVTGQVIIKAAAGSVLTLRGFGPSMSISSNITSLGSDTRKKHANASVVILQIG